MKKTLASFFAVFLVFSASSVFAQMPLGVSVMPTVAPAFEKIGVVAAVQGKIELKAPGQVGRIAKSGQPVFMGDEVKTDAGGHLQILLLDETVFTIGPNSAIVIDKFVYDPQSHEGEIKASITKGVFRYVSGKIAAKRPNNVLVKLPAATIGFRGTIVAGSVGPGGQGLVGLLGPGSNNDAGEKIGSFTIEGKDGGQKEVNRTGFGVEVDANGGVSNVFRLSSDQVNGLTRGLMPSGGGTHGGRGSDAGSQGEGNKDSSGPRPMFRGGENVGESSGENRVKTAQNGTFVNLMGRFLDRMNDDSTEEAQDSRNSSDNNIIDRDRITRMEELTVIQTGIFHYDVFGTYNHGAGTVQGSCEINFGSKTIGGGNSYIKITSGDYSDRTSGYNDQPRSFSNMTGDAVFSWRNVSGTQGGTFNNIEVALKNVDGAVAQGANVKVVYTSGGSSGIPSGSGIAAGSRAPGPVPEGLNNKDQF
ncbi:MAG: FecR domain-containing protein [Candidatus Omnitrophota bacterium]|jgi:hypothetical protein